MVNTNSLDAISPQVRQARLIAHIVRELKRTGHRVSRFETHISCVLVAGGFAYKFKKAVKFDFLDFSTLDARCFYCHEELRLNRRLAPRLYLDVVSVTGDPEHPRIGGEGEAIEYAVRMHAFEQQALWSYRLENNLITDAEIDELADQLARFHRNAASAPPDRAWGDPQVIASQSKETLRTLSSLVEEGNRPQLAELQAWVGSRLDDVSGAFKERKALGMVRECHGDLHCGNILSTEQGVEIFDCIEFNQDLRWIDVMSDLAFICMDLEFRRQRELGSRLLNHYLEITGDYAGLDVLHYYRVQRALVRSKISFLRARQENISHEDAQALVRQGHEYLFFALQDAKPVRPALMITHGYSGCGKTSFARLVVESLGAIQIRSDVERKRMQGLTAASKGGPALYDSVITEQTYDCLLSIARKILASGLPVIVDAAMLKSAQRQRFADLASELGIPFFIFDVQAKQETMTYRLAVRANTGLDASDAGTEILERQLTFAEPLSVDESLHAITVDMEGGTDHLSVRSLCAPVSDAIGLSRTDCSNY